ncbi:MAG: glycosyltransferase family 9 protein [Deltaproteobacteria bacterium]|nr:glycosyltransferase family 9 protein [Candidatus Zymogenaceae bacterium]
MIDKTEKVLVLNIGGIGDMVLATPALECLAARAPGGRLDILTVKRSAPIVEKAPFIGRTYTVDVSVLTGRPSITGGIRFIASIMTLLRLRMKRYGLVVDLMAVESPQAARRRGFLLSLISPSRTAGRNTNGWADYLDVKVGEDLFSNIHETDRKLAVVGALFPDVPIPDMRVFSTERDVRTARGLFDSLRKKDDRGVAILVPGAWRPTRRWDAKRFVIVGNHLARRHRLSVAVCGSSHENDIVQSVARGVKGASILIDVPTRVLFEMIGRCDIMITNDTGPMHLAAASQGPGIVAIFGPENPDRYAPTDRAGVVVISDRVECSPCVRYSCDDMRCLEGIDAKRVLDAVDTLMAQRHKRGIGRRNGRK